MDVICAWCEKEGTRTKLGEKEGPEGVVSHGICDMHQEQFLEEIMRAKMLKRAANPRKRRRK